VFSLTLKIENELERMDSGVRGSNNALALSVALILRWTYLGVKCNRGEIKFAESLSAITENY